MGFFNRFGLALKAASPVAASIDQNARDLITLGNTLEDANLLMQALQHYKAAIALAPKLAHAHLSRGNIFFARGKLKGALASYEVALRCEPNYAAGHYSKGRVYAQLDMPEEALASFRRATELNPDFVDAHVGSGWALERVARYSEAQSSYLVALSLRPNYAEVHSNLGNALTATGRFGEAVDFFLRALELKPDSAVTLNNLGNAFKGLDRFDDAIKCYERAIILKPDFADARCNLGGAYMALGQPDCAADIYRGALACRPDHAEALSKLLFSYNFSDECRTKDSLTDAKRFGDLATQRAITFAEWPNSPEPFRCLRVGFVSGDLRQHPVGNFLEGVLRALALDSAGRLEIFAYASCPDTDSVTERIRGTCHGWRTVVGLSDERLGRLVRDDRIDILIDLSGHTAFSRLLAFAWKPAPIQVSWLGYFATTGVKEVDYLIADPFTLPVSEDANYTETIWRLPETRLCFTPPDVFIEVSPLPALKNGYITFASFNNLNKMNPAVISAWAQVLASVPRSRLFLKSKRLADSATRRNTIAQFLAEGICEDRLILEGDSPRADYLASYHRVDIALDPFPYTGGTTTVEALWMGVPVLTLAGKSLLARQGVGLLTNAGFPDWIACNTDDYIDRASRLASDIAFLIELRRGLRDAVLASPVFDTRRFGRHFEAALSAMWRNWCKKRIDATSLNPPT